MARNNSGENKALSSKKNRLAGGRVIDKLAQAGQQRETTNAARTASITTAAGNNNNDPTFKWSVCAELHGFNRVLV